MSEGIYDFDFLEIMKYFIVFFYLGYGSKLNIIFNGLIEVIEFCFKFYYF